MKRREEDDRCRLCNGPSPLQLNLSPKIKADRRASLAIAQSLVGLPQLFGQPISVSTLPSLKAYRGKLVTGDPAAPGTDVHAATFIRHREIILETQLLSRPRSLRLILVHEIFHFIWPRLGNPTRQSFRALLSRELHAGARGEMGESAGVHKLSLPPVDSSASETKWRNYVCESFCDSASWHYAGLKTNPGWTLAARWRKIRQAWLVATFAGPRVC